MSARLHPWHVRQMDDNGFQISRLFRKPIDTRTSAFDAQYQYQGANYWFTLRGTYIHENQKLDATFPTGGSDNPTNTLNTFRALASLAYGNDNRVVLTGQYFDTRVRQTRRCMRIILDVHAVQTATATLPRSPTSRSFPARRQGGRGLMCASVSNTPTTTSSMETRSSLMITTRCSPTFGSRCNRRGRSRCR